MRSVIPQPCIGPNCSDLSTSMSSVPWSRVCGEGVGAGRTTDILLSTVERKMQRVLLPSSDGDVTRPNAGTNWLVLLSSQSERLQIPRFARNDSEGLGMTARGSG